MTSAEVRSLKAQSQKLKAAFKVGRAGLSPEFLRSVEEGLRRRELVKVKFEELKDQKKELAPVLAEKTSSELIWLIGNVAVLYRKKAEAQPEAGNALD